jgi:hypothetical protein
MKKMMFAALVSIATLPAFAAPIDGEYKYQSKSDDGSVKIKQIAPNKIKFNIDTVSKKGDMCAADGTATLAGNKAIFKDEVGKIEISFEGNKLTVKSEGGSYCGMSASMDGSYIKKKAK